MVATYEELLQLRCEIVNKRQSTKCPDAPLCPVPEMEFNLAAYPDRKFCWYEDGDAYSAYECRQQSAGEPGMGASCASSAVEAARESGCDLIPSLNRLTLAKLIETHTNDDAARVLQIEPWRPTGSSSLLDQIAPRYSWRHVSHASNPPVGDTSSLGQSRCSRSKRNRCLCLVRSERQLFHASHLSRWKRR